MSKLPEIVEFVHSGLTSVLRYMPFIIGDKYDGIDARSRRLYEQHYHSTISQKTRSLAR